MQPNKKLCQVLLPDTPINLQLLIIIKNFSFIVKKDFSNFGDKSKYLVQFYNFLIIQLKIFLQQVD